MLSNVTTSQNETSACDSIQLFIVQGGSIHEHVKASVDIGIGATAAFCFVVGAFFVFWGGRYFKLFASILTAIASFWGVHYVFHISTVSNLSCAMEFLVAALAAVIMAVAVGCIIKLALFAVGAAFFGASTHFLFQALPELESVGGTPQVLGRSFVYYGSVALASVVGGVAIRCRERQALEACTSLLGGVLVALGVLASLQLADAKVDGFVYVALVLGLACVGIWYQRRARIRRKKKHEYSKRGNE